MGYCSSLRCQETVNIDKRYIYSQYITLSDYDFLNFSEKILMDVSDTLAFYEAWYHEEDVEGRGFVMKRDPFLPKLTSKYIYLYYLLFRLYENDSTDVVDGRECLFYKDQIIYDYYPINHQLNYDYSSLTMFEFVQYGLRNPQARIYHAKLSNSKFFTMLRNYVLNWIVLVKKFDMKSIRDMEIPPIPASFSFRPDIRKSNIVIDAEEYQKLIIDRSD